MELPQGVIPANFSFIEMELPQGVIPANAGIHNMKLTLKRLDP